MDTSATYIKMCEKAEEIQDTWRNADMSVMPSFVYAGRTERVSIMIWTPETLANMIRKTYPEQGNSLIASVEWGEEKFQEVPPTIEHDWHHETIWLPRQDQLQEMAGGQLWSKSDRFNVWCHSKYGFPGAWSDWTLQFTSMEQLWLAFVMKEQYNKVWSGKEWIPEKN